VNLNFMPTSASAPKHVLDFFLNELKLYPAGRHGDRLFRRHVQWQASAMDKEAHKLYQPGR
jgi:hypothetical protein